MLPFNIRDALLCLTFLVGAGAGILIISRQHKKTGGLMLAGFLLLGLDPIAEVLILSVLMGNYSGDNYQTFNWAYVCISTLVIILGVGCLIAAIFSAMKPIRAETGNEVIESPNS